MVDETKKKQSSGNLNKAELKLLNLNTVEDRTPGSANYSGFLQSGTKANAPGGTPEDSKKEKIMKQLQKILQAAPSTLPIAGLRGAMQVAGKFNDPMIKNLVEKVKDKFGKKDGGAVRKGDSEAVQMYKHGGEVKKKKSKLAGRLAQRGYGKARK
tara:strand:- start:783 stop:1247 length:465 start_codon:yes stop_codon:yes gene_type:complete